MLISPARERESEEEAKRAGERERTKSSWDCCSGRRRAAEVPGSRPILWAAFNSSLNVELMLVQRCTVR